MVWSWPQRKMKLFQGDPLVGVSYKTAMAGGEMVEANTRFRQPV